AGFWGEFPAILAAYQPADGLPIETFRTFMVVASIGTVFAAGYLLWMLQRTAFGEVPEEWKDENQHDHPIRDMHWPEYVAWAPLLVLIVVLGVYPNLLFGIMDESVTSALSVFGG
ncbi:MAG TPA: NADH-quinone oxidoreductase subunit M, partial [Acidimicrobiales bacterium]|nr:NADH-quinone oxidoreductase subunit M [Acidimicrobiales bacterium]